MLKNGLYIDVGSLTVIWNQIRSAQGSDKEANYA